MGERAILFITRKYPPSVGGMQKLSYELTTRISKERKIHVISWGRDRQGLPLFIFWAFVRAIYLLLREDIALIHLSDPLLSPLGLALQVIRQIPVVVNAHGLDITYPNHLYQMLIPAFLRHLTCVICISMYTKNECIKRGIPATRCEVIPPGIDVNKYIIKLSDVERATWLSLWGVHSPYTKILLTSGRLIQRKGVTHFILKGLPLLAAQRKDWVYLIVGEGPERPKIEEAIRTLGFSQHIKILGKLQEHELRIAYALADVFVMPNIPITGNPEGFGIVALEARASGVPVVASDLEGIREAVGGCEDGTLIKPGDWSAFVAAINWWLDRSETILDRERRRERVKAEFDWSVIIPKYLTLFQFLENSYSKKRNRHADSN
jgi:phosphatidylinositol alpha-1,6-mannosyltransferase